MISALSSRLMLLKHSSPPPSSISPSPLVCLQQPWKLMVCPSTPFSPYVFITSLIGASIANQVMNRVVIRSRTGPDRTGPVWTEDRIRVKVWTEDRTSLRLVLDRTGPVKPGTGPDRSWAWTRQKSGTGCPCHLFFWGHGQTILRGTTVPLLFVRSTLFFLRHGQPVLRGTTVLPILFGPLVQSTGPDRDQTEDQI